MICYAATFRDAPSAARRRSSKRCNFPVCVFGSSVTYSIARGYLYGATVAPYKYPRAIEFVAELPKTQTGKLQRFELRRRAAEGASRKLAS